MLIYCDKAVEQRLTGFQTIDKLGNIVDIIPMSKDKHNELRDEATYPSITWQRIDRSFDVTRFQNGRQEFITKDDAGIDYVELYQMPNPYNISYQIELIAKEKYDADLLDEFLDRVIRPRGDMISIRCHIEDANEDKDIKFPLFVTESRSLNDYSDSKNIYYRRVVTISIRLFIDPDTVEDGGYMIKSDVRVEELENPII